MLFRSGTTGILSQKPPPSDTNISSRAPGQFQRGELPGSGPFPIIERMTKLRNRKLTCTAITGDFIRRGIAPLQRRSQPLWEIRQKMGILLSWAKWGKSMLFLIPGVPYFLPPNVCPLFEGPGDGAVSTPMPPCNAFGFLGKQFLDPLPVPKESVALGLRSSAAVGPPFGDVSPKEPGSSDGDDEKETASGAQA